MNQIVETNESGGLYLSPDLLGPAAKYRQFSMETEGDMILLRPLSASRSVWESRSPKERAAEFRRWAESQRTTANLPVEALSRENIYA
jgi:hypothetical protein